MFLVLKKSFVLRNSAWDLWNAAHEGMRMGVCSCEMPKIADRTDGVGPIGNIMRQEKMIEQALTVLF